ncbi:cryptochrome-1-like [Diadema antillarum]|uniref:cryptochrome-1-like n=1 Tax=Diadema antillarum TaxID=105358 RepID=UPI003A886D4C
MPKRKRSSEKRGCLVHWFRKGLRLHDNPALKEGIKGANGFRCIYILDPWFAGSCSKGVNRWRFLLECLEDLDSSLRRLNSRLFLVRGQPADVLPRLFKEWKVTLLSFEEDSEPYGRTRDQAISTLAQEAGVKVISKVSHTLYDPQEILALNNNEPPLTYKRFQDIISMMGIPVYPVEAIEAEDVEGLNTYIEPNHDDKYGIPTLEELGFEMDDVPPPMWIGGETEARQRLDRHLERKAWVANFERPRMSPASLMASPAGLSPYLRFGCLSPRTFYWKLTELYQKVRKTTHTPLSLHGQLLWREFFFTVACNNRMFDRMVDNPICIQIPWDKNPEMLNKWANGETGFPWIDAIMTQLRLEGWIHPLARHAVACFLTRGDLWMSWEEGMKVFDEYLLDADWSVNAGNWIWLSCSSFYQQFFHCYCPVKFGRRTDPNGDYVRKYLPVLKNFPSKYIFEPWTAPLEVQEKAKCIIGKDYNFPIVDHAEASHRNIERMRKVYNNLSRHGGPGLLGSVPSSKEASEPPQNTKSVDSILLRQKEVAQHRHGVNPDQPDQPMPNKMQFMGRSMGVAIRRGHHYPPAPPVPVDYQTSKSQLTVPRLVVVQQQQQQQQLGVLPQDIAGPSSSSPLDMRPGTSAMVHDMGHGNPHLTSRQYVNQ